MRTSSDLRSPAAARPVAGRALDHDFLTLNRHVDLLVLGVHFLADLHLASIHWLLVGSQMFFPDLDSST